MHFLAYLIIPVVLSVIFAGACKQSFRAEENMQENNFIVRLPKTFVFIGIIGALFFGALII